MRLLGILAAAVAISLAALLWVNRDLPPDKLEAKYANDKSQFIEAAGARFHYRDEGEGPVILLIHGYMAHLQTWDGWTDALSSQYRVIRLDLPGHGLTGPYDAGDYSPEGQTRMVAAFIDALGLQDVVIGGSSLGGLVAWRYALEHPEKVSALILVSPGGYLAPGAEENTPGDVPAVATVLRYVSPKFMMRAVLEQLYTDDSKVTDELVERYRDLVRRQGNRAALLTALGQFTLYHPDEALSRIAAPTLIIWGEDDQTLPVSDAKRFHEALPNSELTVFDNLGHVPMEEAPRETASKALEFLDRRLNADGTDAE